MNTLAGESVLIIPGYYMPSFKYVIELSDAEQAVLNDIVSKGTNSARTMMRANVLLASDKNSKRYLSQINHY